MEKGDGLRIFIFLGLQDLWREMISRGKREEDLDREWSSRSKDRCAGDTDVVEFAA